LEFLRAPRTDGSLDPIDKLRLVLMFYLSAADNAISREDIAELEKELKSAGADLASFEYVRRTREISRMTSSVSAGSVGTSTPSLGGVAGQGGELFKGFSALGNKVQLGKSSNIYHFLINLSSLLTALKTVDSTH
jgi:hypothetical protein